MMLSSSLLIWSPITWPLHASSKTQTQPAITIFQTTGRNLLAALFNIHDWSVIVWLTRKRINAILSTKTRPALPSWTHGCGIIWTRINNPEVILYSNNLRTKNHLNGYHSLNKGIVFMGIINIKTTDQVSLCDDTFTAICSWGGHRHYNLISSSLAETFLSRTVHDFSIFAEAWKEIPTHLHKS